MELVAVLDSGALFSDLTAGATVSSARSLEVGCLPGKVAMGIEDLAWFGVGPKGPGFTGLRGWIPDSSVRQTGWDR